MVSGMDIDTGPQRVRQCLRRNIILERVALKLRIVGRADATPLRQNNGWVVRWLAPQHRHFRPSSGRPHPLQVSRLPGPEPKQATTSPRSILPELGLRLYLVQITLP